MEKRLKKVLKNTKPQKVVGSLNRSISGLAYNSRDVEPGSLFFAMKGLHHDGHSFISEAIERGAVAIVCSHLPQNLSEEVTYIVVDNPQLSMAPLSAEFYDHPSKKLFAIGVTGTDGKSTTSYFIYQLLTLAGKKSGIISTVFFQSGDTIEANKMRLSTPEAPVIQKMLWEMVEAGCEYVVIESTSHGLSERTGRLKNIDFNMGVMTTITQEHLDFHETIDQYREDKANLIRYVNNSKGVAILNQDDPLSRFFESMPKVPPFLYYSIGNEADLEAVDVRGSVTSCYFTLQGRAVEKPQSVTLPIPGRFNVENLLAALLAVSKAINTSAEGLAWFAEKIKAPPGRMVNVNEGQDFNTLVDYAHTPGAYKKLLPFLRASVPEGQIILIFGSAGERDVEKRSEQGELADEYGDVLILTDEDPRLEDSMTILQNIAEGIKEKRVDETLFFIPDRREAIKKGLSLAEKGDLVAILGKGHESSIIYREGPQPWNEIETVKELLREL